MYFRIHTVRILYILVAVVLVGFTVKFKDASGDFPASFFAVYITYVAVSNLIGSTEFLSTGSMFSNVADPAIGGTYMVILIIYFRFGPKL